MRNHLILLHVCADLLPRHGFCLVQNKHVAACAIAWQAACCFMLLQHLHSRGQPQLLT